MAASNVQDVFLSRGLFSLRGGRPPSLSLLSPFHDKRFPWNIMAPLEQMMALYQTLMRHHKQKGRAIRFYLNLRCFSLKSDSAQGSGVLPNFPVSSGPFFEKSWPLQEGVL